MDRLEKFFEDIGVIRQILERGEADKVAAVIAPKQVPVQQEVPQTIPVQSQVPVQPIIPQQTPVNPLPTTAQVESFTQEQIAIAMSNAQAAGKMDLIQNIFNTFGVQTLMQISPANYNQIAVMLREAGIQV